MYNLIDEHKVGYCTEKGSKVLCTSTQYNVYHSIHAEAVKFAHLKPVDLKPVYPPS